MARKLEKIHCSSTANSLRHLHSMQVCKSYNYRREGCTDTGEQHSCTCVLWHEYYIYTLIIIIHSCQECWLCNTCTVLSKTLQCIQQKHYRSIDHKNIATLLLCVYQLLDYHERVHAHVLTLAYADTINHAHIASTPICTLTYS